MSKGLEALQDLRCMTSLSQDCPYKESNDLCDIIEKELKALEIIRKWQVNVYDIINSVDYNHYCVLMAGLNRSWILPKKKYDLLKEVLL